MPRLVLRAPSTLERGFAAIRTEQDVPVGFPPEVLEAAEAARPPDLERLDARHLDLVAIDPPGATDLDQAFFAERNGDGYRVFYAIADVGAFLEPGGPIDLEARRRGTTLYSPDLRTPLHPPTISDDRASLLPGSDKPSLLWRIELDGDGLPTGARLQRARVRIREAISYAEAQRRIDAAPSASDVGDASLSLLREIGLLREAREADRGGISLSLPSQEVVSVDGTYALAYDEARPVEGWNAQMSLLAGIVAGTTMFDAGVGILRTLPSTSRQDLHRLLNEAAALGVRWPEGVDYPDFIRTVEPDTPQRAAFLLKAARAFRGAGYVGFDVAGGSPIPDEPEHGAIASIYSHVTAPLRRLVDRFGNEILLALHADERPPTWAVEALDELPSLMGRAASRTSALERAMVDYLEAMVLEPHVGETFDGFVVDVDERRGRAVVQLTEPAVVANVEPEGRTLAERLRLRLDAVDPSARTVTFTPE